jgi:hypothetical protein
LLALSVLVVLFGSAELTSGLDPDSSYAALLAAQAIFREELRLKGVPEAEVECEVALHAQIFRLEGVSPVQVQVQVQVGKHTDIHKIIDSWKTTDIQNETTFSPLMNISNVVTLEKNLALEIELSSTTCSACGKAGLCPLFSGSMKELDLPYWECIAGGHTESSAPLEQLPNFMTVLAAFLGSPNASTTDTLPFRTDSAPAYVEINSTTTRIVTVRRCRVRETDAHVRLVLLAVLLPAAAIAFVCSDYRKSCGTVGSRKRGVAAARS